MKVLLGITGSVAATLSKKLVQALHNAEHEVRVVVTPQSQYFFSKKCLGVQVYTEAEEWPNVSYQKGEDIQHIELSKWADVLLIAPLTANTLAKMANGLSDNLLTCIARAWSLSKPIVVAPAMNTEMWKHPLTTRQIDILTAIYETGFNLVHPVAKMLACGDEGVGAMAQINDIVEAVNESIFYI